MKINYYEQYSNEWWEARQLKLTASHAQAIAANGKGLQTYVRQIMAEYYSSAGKEVFENEHTRRGLELESEARLAYSAENMVEVKEVGFVEMNEYVGCSPDGLVEDGLIEIKCLSDKVYLDLLLDEKIETKYIWQTQMQMLVCEANFCDFVAFNPNFDTNLWVKRLKPNMDNFEALRKGFDSGIKIIKEIQGKME